MAAVNTDSEATFMLANETCLGTFLCNKANQRRCVFVNSSPVQKRVMAPACQLGRVCGICSLPLPQTAPRNWGLGCLKCAGGHLHTFIVQTITFQYLGTFLAGFNLLVQMQHQLLYITVTVLKHIFTPDTFIGTST